MRAYDLIGGFGWLLLSVLIVVGSVELGIGSLRQPDAGLFSLITGVILGCLSLLLVVESSVPGKGGRTEQAAVWSRETRWGNLLLTVLALTVYTVVLTPLGFMISTFLLMVFLYRAIEPQGWLTAFLFATVSASCGWLVFEVWLQCQLPEGFIVSWLRGLF
jgi:putative tricarboxylic transport membrane protein